MRGRGRAAAHLHLLEDHEADSVVWHHLPPPAALTRSLQRIGAADKMAVDLEGVGRYAAVKRGKALLPCHRHKCIYCVVVMPM